MAQTTGQISGGQRELRMRREKRGSRFLSLKSDDLFLPPFVFEVSKSVGNFPATRGEWWGMAGGWLVVGVV
jgi:hypothetical protein